MRSTVEASLVGGDTAARFLTAITARYGGDHQASTSGHSVNQRAGPLSLSSSSGRIIIGRMKKNPWTRAGAFGVLALCATSACARRPGAPPGYQGTVELEERVLSFEVTGRLVEVPVHRGDRVADGQVVAKLDDALARLTRDARAEEARAASADVKLLAAGARTQDVAALRADVNAAGANVDLARKTAERVRALEASGAVARAELDRAEADLDRATEQREAVFARLSSLRSGARPEELARATARADAARSALALEDARLARHELRVRSDGLVLDVALEPGELAAVGAAVVTVADVTHPFVDVFVPVGELTGLIVGTKADVRVDSAANASAGQIEYISPKTEFTPRFLFSDRERPNIVTRVRVRVTDPERQLHAGVPAFVTFQRGSGPSS